MPLERLVSSSQGLDLSDLPGPSCPRRPSASLGAIPGLWVAASLIGLLGACGGGGSEGRQSGITGAFVSKTGGGVFIVDENHSGSARRFEIADVYCTRLVDVHAVILEGPSLLTSTWIASPTPLFVDYAIGLDIASDGVNYRLDTNPVTQRTKLVILREAPASFPTVVTPKDGQFMDLLRGLTENLTPLSINADDGTTSGSIDVVPRNSALAVRFNDVLDDNDPAALFDNIKVQSGYPPLIPYEARVFFDANHGAILSDGFHSTRVIIDLAITDAELLASPRTLISNALGLPASRSTSFDPNVSIKIPTSLDIASGQRSLLKNAGGLALSIHTNGPVASARTQDIVRAMRSGNDRELNGGFMPDDLAPQVLAEWDFTIDDARINTQAEFALDLTFPTACRDTLFAGQVLEINSKFLEVVVLTSGSEVVPSGAGVALNVLVRSATPVAVQLADLTGVGTFLPTYSQASGAPAPDACWVRFQAGGPNLAFDDLNGIWTGVSTTAVPTVRFTEAMTPNAVSALDSLMVIRGDETTSPVTNNIVVGTLQAGTDSSRFRFQAGLPFTHVSGSSEDYHVFLETARRPTDLAGNVVSLLPGPMVFQLDPNETTVDNGGLVIRFTSDDEVAPIGDDPNTTVIETPIPDFRGQLFYDLARGTIFSRDALYSSYPADSGNPIFGTPPGVWTASTFTQFEPLSPLGCKLQTVWRHSDLAWRVMDETKMNIDVVGLNWAPFGGIASAEFYENFEIALSHSVRLPDEGTVPITSGMTTSNVTFPTSGLLGGPNLFTDNVLMDPLSPTKVVHHRSQGYQINPVDRFLASSGTTMMPFPALSSDHFLWRDTAAQGVGGASSGGVPTAMDVFSMIEPAGTAGVQTGIYGPGSVPTFGLPLLMEFRCFPSQTALGRNSFAYLTPLIPGSGPTFRTWSVGGTNSQGDQVKKNPDFQLVPSGGFNPFSSPAGLPTLTSADMEFFQGQLDTVTRVSRAHSMWLDTGNTAPTYLLSVIEPDPTEFPTGTQFLIDYRGADSFGQGLGNIPFNSASLDPYGNLLNTQTVNFSGTGASWKSSISGIDGARYMQIRLTWINNITANLGAEVSALGFAFNNN